MLSGQSIIDKRIGRAVLKLCTTLRVAQALNLNHLGPDPYPQSGDNKAQRLTPKAVINREVKKRTWWQLVIQGKSTVNRLLMADLWVLLTVVRFRLVSCRFQQMQR